MAKNLKEGATSVKVVELPNLPEKGDISDWAKTEGNNKAKLAEIIKQAPEWKKTEENTQLAFLQKGSDLIKLNINIEWVVNRLIPKESITLLHGKGGIGKTWLSLIIANSISKGEPFMNLPTGKTSVVFIDFENSLAVLVDRLKKINASDVLFWHNSNTEKPPKLDSGDWNRYKTLPQGSLLIFDTLRASQSKDENNSKDMAFVLCRLKELRDLGFTIILLHHTPKSNDSTYKGSTAILDLADHILSLQKVKRGSPDDIIDDEEEENCYYRLGTKDKTRYEPYHIFLDFDPEKGFVIAPDPDEEVLKSIHEIIVKLNNLKTELPIQSEIIKKVKNDLGLSNNKTRRLLKKGEDKFWNSSKKTERKNATAYKPISVFQFSTPIYSEQTEKLPVNDKNNISQDLFKSLNNTKFASFPEGIKQTDKQVLEIDTDQKPIDLTGVDILEVN